MADQAIVIDKWYYIMDRGFYYYRLNNNSQLVVATSKAEADIFSYEEASRRIGSGKKAQFYVMVPTEEEQAVPQMTESSKTEFIVMEENSYQQSQAVEKPWIQNTYDLSALDWKEYLTQFSYIASGVKRYHDDLTEQLSEVDQKICDLMHFIELYDLSDEESLHVVEELKVYREQRREIKDNMLIADTFGRLVGTSNNIAKSKETIKAIAGLEKRKYAPRQLMELFEGRTLEVPKKVTRFPIHRQEESQHIGEEVRMEDITEDTTKNGMEETTNKSMQEYTWRETVFDGKQTDWRAYVKQQMEFFEQAEQYICNLQIELDEIDARIQDILTEIEDANYNAVQGYNVFKQLKELRNVRKEKLRNLRCVETMVGCFNCESMYEAYGYSMGVIEEIVGE